MTLPLIALENITARLRDRWYLNDTSWEIGKGEQWAILGPNGSGKTTLARTIAGRVPVVKGRVRRNLTGPIFYVSSEERGEIFRRERALDEARDFSGRKHETTAVKDILCPCIDKWGGEAEAEDLLKELCADLDLAFLLDRSVNSLSTGEMSKVLIARALLRRPALLILDEPFDGLDKPSRNSLEKTLSNLMTKGLHCVLITHRTEEIFPGLTHVLVLNEGSLFAGGKREEILVNGKVREIYRQLFPEKERPSYPGLKRAPFKAPSSSVMIEMEKVTVRHGDTVALGDVSWKMSEGENWAVTGPNGSGKSTLLSLITGDELQAYANRITLFGKKRGTGESVWEIKKKIGTISHALSTRYQQNLSVFDVVCSGFFDSIGLYRMCTREQEQTALKWIRLLGIKALSGHCFSNLSYGQRQLVLITRAIVKTPLILILDEPCAGLDPVNREKVLGMVEFIGSATSTNLIYVTHHREEILPCITHQLTLDKGKLVE